MENTTLIDANALLALPAWRAGELFKGTRAEMKALYRRLVHRWHPDHSADPRAHEVFIHLQGLYEAAAVRKAPAVELHFQDQAGRTFRFQAQSCHAFELGRRYRGKGSVAYVVAAADKAAFENFQARVGGLDYASEQMRQQFAPQLPSLHAAHWGNDGGLIVIKRDPDGVLLGDLVEHMAARGEHLDPRHVGWILNGLHNLACYLSHARIAHHAIGLDTIWINPKRHSVELLGGWFHSLPFDTPIRALPAFTASLAPRSYLRDKVATARLDLESVRGIGRMLLGDVSGNRLDPATPSPMVSALRLPASGTAVEEYQRWKQALLASFGAPKFVPLELSRNDIYPGE